MVNIAMLMATGAEQVVMPHLRGTSTAGVAPVSFLKSIERCVGAGFGKSVLPEGMPAGMVGAKSSALRIGLICVEGNETAAGTEMPTEAKEPGGDPQLSLSRGSGTSVQETVAAGSEKEDLTQGASAIAVEDVPLNPKVLPAQRPDAESSITSAGQERHSEEAAATPVREPRTETAAKAKAGGRKDEASSDAPAVLGDTAATIMSEDPFALSLAGQPPKPVVAVAVPSSIVQPVKDSKDAAEIPNVSATGGVAGGAKKRVQSLKASASPKEKLALAGAEGRSGKTTLEDDGVRDKGFHPDDLSRFSAHETSAAPGEGTGKPLGFPGSEVQVMPLSPLMKHQAHTMTSSAGRDVSVGESAHASLRGDAGAFEQPVASVGEHRALAASPTMLEVGVSGGSHGWLKIRAELAGDGAVHASVSSSSAAGAEMLRRELPSLTTYLHQEQVAVGSLVVHASAGTQDSSSMSSGTGESGAGGQQQGTAQHERGQQETSSYREWNEGSWVEGMEEHGTTAWLPQAMYAGSGGWLSVRA